ncbi:MAG: T9SS type A sorting domain-containing protein [Bacteroidales bacterium]|nr:T9SS type A sorting domain-containing protein [Bacteroidales bacterium]MDD4218297.1 T9SS type A sorting domain-containing protein [Bacteroidales bacterium]MDY0142563.1 T9SS type A sorting domain-containing protein [Bacteroidales bacterium]
MHKRPILGIEDFVALAELNCNFNQLSSLDVSQNTNLTSLKCDDNQLLSLDVSANIDLTEISCNFNQLESLDVSVNSDLYLLICNNNQLSSIDVRNENNANVFSFNAENNPDLICIYVDDKTAEYLSSWTKDETAQFVNDENECLELLVNDTEEQVVSIYPNPTYGILNFDFLEESVQTIKISDITGKTIFVKNNLKQTEVIDLSNFANGLYIVTLQTDKGSSSLKIIKE